MRCLGKPSGAARSLDRRLPRGPRPPEQSSRGRNRFFFARNVPLALVFALPHSLLRPARLYRAPYIGRFGRLLYNILSAVTLHIFLLGFTPLSSPVVMVLPLPEKFHALLSVSCLFAAVSAFLLTPETWGLLGAGQLLGWSGRWRSNPERGMDAITWMGVTAWRAGAAVGGPITGALAFVAFTGISILPSELTLGDCLTRFIAAVYLRQRSRSFRVWVDSIEGAHLLGWGIRAGLLCAAVFDFAGTRRNTPATESNRLGGDTRIENSRPRWRYGTRGASPCGRVQETHAHESIAESKGKHPSSRRPTVVVVTDKDER